MIEIAKPTPYFVQRQGGRFAVYHSSPPSPLNASDAMTREQAINAARTANMMAGESEVNSWPNIFDRYILKQSVVGSSRETGISRCRIGVLEIRPGFVKEPKAISARSRGVVRVMKVWEYVPSNKDNNKYTEARSEAEWLAWCLNTHDEITAMKMTNHHFPKKGTDQ